MGCFKTHPTLPGWRAFWEAMLVDIPIKNPTIDAALFVSFLCLGVIRKIYFMFGKEYRAVFKKKRQRFIIVIATMVIVTIVSVIGLALFQWPEEILEVAMLIPLVGGVVWLLFDWRCPQCSKSFIRESNPKFCSGCGLQVRE